MILQGKADGLFRENTVGEPSVVAATAGPKSFEGLDRDLLTVDTTGRPLIVRGDLPEDLAYELARELNEQSTRHHISHDIFYSLRFAPLTGAPLHPGAERSYRAKGIRH